MNEFTFTEADILAVALGYPHRAAELLGDLQPDDFHHAAHSAICRAIRTLLDEGEEPNAAAVGEWLAWRSGHHRDLWHTPLLDAITHFVLDASASWCRHAVLTALARRQAYAMTEGVKQAATTGDMIQLLAALDTGTRAIGHTLARLALEENKNSHLTRGDITLTQATHHLKEAA